MTHVLNFRNFNYRAASLSNLPVLRKRPTHSFRRYRIVSQTGSGAGQCEASRFSSTNGFIFSAKEAKGFLPMCNYFAGCVRYSHPQSASGAGKKVLHIFLRKIKGPIDLHSLNVNEDDNSGISENTLPAAFLSKHGQRLTLQIDRMLGVRNAVVIEIY